VYVLAQRFSKELLLDRVAEDDLGFDRRVLAEMMRTLARFTDEELPVASSEVHAVRAFFRDWADELVRAPT
jgi:hypothetical protein